MAYRIIYRRYSLLYIYKKNMAQIKIAPCGALILASLIGLEPTWNSFEDCCSSIEPQRYLVRLEGVELSTYWFVASCSIH